MSLKLVPPRKDKSPYWTVRGTYLRVYVDRSTKAVDRATATKALKLWKEEIERGTFAEPGQPTFLDAAVNYMAETGNERFVQPVVDHFVNGPSPKSPSRLSTRQPSSSIRTAQRRRATGRSTLSFRRFSSMPASTGS